MLSKISRFLPILFPILLVAGYVWSANGVTAATTTTVGSIETVDGHGWGRTGVFGTRYDKVHGDLIAMDERLGTGYNSAMTMRFIDDTTMALGEDAEIVVDEMVYDPENGKDDRVILKLGTGSFYFVSGKVAKEKVTIVTPTAVIGIRGTELLINVDADGSTSVGVTKGHAYMNDHEGRNSVEIEVGNTAKTDGDGVISDSYPGIDLTGDPDVDRNIPGVSDWLDEDEGEKNRGKHPDFAEQDDDGKEDGKDDGKDDGEDGGEGDDAEGDFADFEGDEGDDGQELASRSDEGEGEDAGDEGGDGAGEEGGDDGGEDGGDDGSDDGGDDGSSDRESDRDRRDREKD